MITHTFTNIFELFSAIRQYVITSGDQVHFSLGAIHYGWFNSDNTIVWQILPNNYPEPDRLDSYFYLDNLSPDEKIMLKVLKCKEFIILTHYLNRGGNKTLNLLAFI